MKVVGIHGYIVAKLLRGGGSEQARAGEEVRGNHQPSLEIVLWLPTQIFSAEELQILSRDKQSYFMFKTESTILQEGTNNHKRYYRHDYSLDIRIEDTPCVYSPIFCMRRECLLPRLLMTTVPGSSSWPFLQQTSVYSPSHAQIWQYTLSVD